MALEKRKSRAGHSTTRASREAAAHLASGNVILRRRGAAAFSHGQDPELRRSSVSRYWNHGRNTHP